MHELQDMQDSAGEASALHLCWSLEMYSGPLVSEDARFSGWVARLNTRKF